jgi:16S rRNA (guanine527-N7)-methyltransferase
MRADNPGLDNVSRETADRLILYERLVRQWTPRINLVSRASLDDLWTRHFADSAQLLALAPDDAKSWADLGSGGGFPGAVIAILAAEKMPRLSVTLVESDTRKATFLRTVFRETGVKATVRPGRIEEVESLGADVVSARALAPLDKLLVFVERHLAVGGKALLPKGAQWQKEVDIAQKSWTFSCEIHKSMTDPSAVILQIGDLSHV